MFLVGGGCMWLLCISFERLFCWYLVLIKTDSPDASGSLQLILFAVHSLRDFAEFGIQLGRSVSPCSHFLDDKSQAGNLT